jgi:flagellar biosynthesis chaperone FliJ
VAKLPEYRLQIVLDQREREKDAAQKELLERQKELNAEQDKLKRIEEMRREVDRKKARATEEFQASLMKAGTNVAEEADRHDWYQKAMDEEALRIDAEILKQKQAIRRAEQKVDEAKQELNRATIALEAMKKHKEKFLKQAKLEADIKEQNVADEVGEVLWLQQQRDEMLRQQARQAQEAPRQDA